MREILNISLPKELAEDIRKEAKEQHSTVSEFMRAIIRAYRKETAYRRVRKSEKEFAQGKTVRLDSLRDLR